MPPPPSIVRPLPEPPHGRGVRRSATLLSSFRYEQSDPDRFYGLLAVDSAREVERFHSLDGAVLLDVGGGPGWFSRAFRARGARVVSIDPDLGELSVLGQPDAGVARGSGLALPVRSSSVDVCYSSNVLEHVPDPERMCDEMVRVTRPDGIAYISYTNWLSPNGGHETGPWHLLMGGRRAAERYAKRNGHRPKNDYGATLFNLSVARMQRWAKQREADGRIEVVDVHPRYHPTWAARVVRVPGVRELLTWNHVLVVRPRA